MLVLNMDDFKIEAYGTVTPPPELKDGEPNEGEGQDEEE